MRHGSHGNVWSLFFPGNRTMENKGKSIKVRARVCTGWIWFSKCSPSLLHSSVLYDRDYSIDIFRKQLTFSFFKKDYWIFKLFLSIRSCFCATLQRTESDIIFTDLLRFRYFVDKDFFTFIIEYDFGSKRIHNRGHLE